MDRHLKERLVGAAVLVAAAIILIPEMLSGPHDASSPSAPAKPAQDGMKTYTIDLNAPKERVEPAQAPTPAPEIAAAPAPQIAEVPPPQAEPSEHSANVAVQPAPQMAAPAQAVPDRAPARVAERNDTPASSKPDKPAVAPVAAQSNPAATSGAWAVQVASFGQRATSERIADDLKVKGFSAYVMSVAVKDQTMYRVRVGPVRDRDAAEALLQKIKPLHPSAAVVTQ